MSTSSPERERFIPPTILSRGSSSNGSGSGKKRARVAKKTDDDPPPPELYMDTCAFKSTSDERTRWITRLSRLLTDVLSELPRDAGLEQDTAIRDTLNRLSLEEATRARVDLHSVLEYVISVAVAAGAFTCTPHIDGSRTLGLREIEAPVHSAGLEQKAAEAANLVAVQRAYHARRAMLHAAVCKQLSSVADPNTNVYLVGLLPPTTGEAPRVYRERGCNYHTVTLDVDTPNFNLERIA